MVGAALLHATAAAAAVTPYRAPTRPSETTTTAATSSQQQNRTSTAAAQPWPTQSQTSTSTLVNHRPIALDTSNWSVMPTNASSGAASSSTTANDASQKNTTRPLTITRFDELDDSVFADLDY